MGHTPLIACAEICCKVVFPEVQISTASEEGLWTWVKVGADCRTQYVWNSDVLWFPCKNKPNEHGIFVFSPFINGELLTAWFFSLHFFARANYCIQRPFKGKEPIFKSMNFFHKFQSVYLNFDSVFFMYWHHCVSIAGIWWLCSQWWSSYSKIVRYCQF